LGRNFALGKIIPLASEFAVGVKGAKIAAGLAGFGLETAAFTTLTAGSAAVFNGRPLPTAEEWLHDAFHNALFLAPIKGAMEIGGALRKGMMGYRAFAVQQSALMAGIVGGQGLQRLFGLKGEQSLEQAIGESLLTFATLNVGGALTQRFGGKY